MGALLPPLEVLNQPEFDAVRFPPVQKFTLGPCQAADMIDYYVELVGVDHIGIATDDVFTEGTVVGFATDNADAYDDEGYMVNAFNLGATGSGELAKILPAITDELWKRGYTNEDLEKLHAANMMRVHRQVWK